MTREHYVSTLYTVLLLLPGINRCVYFPNIVQYVIQKINTHNVNVLSEMIDIRNGLIRCQILYKDDVNSIITDITVF